MPDDQVRREAGSVWRDQPEETLTVSIEQIVGRRTAELHARTRSETLMSIAAAVLLGGVVALRMAPGANRVEWIGLGAVVVWAVITVVWFRRRLSKWEAPDA